MATEPHQLEKHQQRFHQHGFDAHDSDDCDWEELGLDAQSQLAWERGMRILEMLQHAARAARLEAQVVELQAALNQARNGDASLLHSWLEAFHQPLPTVATVEPANDESMDAPRAERFLERLAEPGWAVYLPHARRRLEAISAHRNSQGGHSLPWLDRLCPDRSDVADHRCLRGGADTRSAMLDDDLNSGDNFCVDVLVEARLEPIDERTCDEHDTGVNADVNEISAQLSVETLADWKAMRSKDAESTEPSELNGLSRLRKRLLSSYGLSVLGHAAALIVLGMMTYQEASDGSSLGAQVLSAAEARSETELTSQVEMLEPTEVQITEPMMASTPASIASELSHIAASVNAVAVDVSVASTGVSIANALSESATASSSGSRGSGVPSMNGAFFGVGSGGNYFCYVVDSSGSMRGGAWESAKAELVRSLKSLKATQKFYIVFFADDFEALPEPGSDKPATTGLYATPENVDHARRWIQSIQLNRGGPPTEALAWAIDREPDAIYLLTDGVTKVDVCGFLRKSNRIEDIVSGPQVRVPVHAIAYFSLDGQQLMRQLAKENQGQFIYVPKPKK